MTDAFAEELRDLALVVAREAATLIRERRRAGVQVADTKTSNTDIVTEADRASEELCEVRAAVRLLQNALVAPTGVGLQKPDRLTEVTVWSHDA